MTSEKTYQGWTNYETWAVNLWISNEESTHLYWTQEQAHDHYEAAVERAQRRADKGDRESWTDEAVRSLADQMKEAYEEGAETLLETGKGSGTIWADLLNAALEEVNWDELARTYIEALDRDEIEADAV